MRYIKPITATIQTLAAVLLFSKQVVAQVNVNETTFQSNCGPTEVSWVSEDYNQLKLEVDAFGNRRAIGSPSTPSNQARIRCSGRILFTSSQRMQFYLVETRPQGIASVTRSGLVTIRDASVTFFPSRRETFETVLNRPFFGKFDVTSENDFDGDYPTRCSTVHDMGIVTTIEVRDGASTSIVSPILVGGGSTERYFRHTYIMHGWEC